MDHSCGLFGPPVQSSSITTSCLQFIVEELTCDSGSVLRVKIGIDLLEKNRIR